MTRPVARPAPPRDDPPARIINAYDVGGALRDAGYRGPIISVRSGFRAGFGFKEWRDNSPNAGWRTWDEMAAAYPRVERWVTPKGKYLTGIWFSASALQYATDLRTSNDKPVRFVEGVGCDHTTSGEWGGDTCGKPAPVGQVARQPYGGARGGGNACGLHFAVVRRVEANNEQRRADSEARDRRYRAEREARSASVDWAARLAEEYGVKCDPDRHGDAGLRVMAEPEHLYALLTAAAGLLRDVGVEWSEVQAEVAG